MFSSELCLLSSVSVSSFSFSHMMLFLESFFFIRSCKFAFFYKGYLNQGTGWFQLIFPLFVGPILTEKPKIHPTEIWPQAVQCYFTDLKFSYLV